MRQKRPSRCRQKYTNMRGYIDASKRIQICIVFILIGNFATTNAFLPNRLSAISPDDFTLEDITKLGIIRALEHDQESVLPTTWSEASFDQILHRVIPDAERRPAFLKAVEEIVYYNVIADVTHSDQPEWQFADEKIRQGNELLIRLNARLVQILAPTTPNYVAARQTLGEIFHLIQTFYSNTNWVEVNETAIYSDLGVAGRPFMPTAPAQVDTCSACGSSLKTTCVDNLLVKDFLTSGYINRQVDTTLSTLPEGATLYTYTAGPEARLGKCRDSRADGDGMTSSDNTVAGGIGKASGEERLSPHFYNHVKAAKLAIAHTQRLLDDKDYGLRSMVYDVTFYQLLGLQGQMDSNVMYIDLRVNDGDVDDIIRELNDTLIDAGDWQIVSGTPPNTDTREKRAAVTGIDIYNLIASQSGGSVYTTSKASIAAVVDIIKASMTSNPPVTITKLRLPPTGSDDIFLPIDDQIHNLTVKIQGSSPLISPSPQLYQPNGAMVTFINGSGSTLQSLGMQLVVLKLTAPIGGRWRLHRRDNTAWDVEVTAKSNLDFTFSFLQPGPGGHGFYPLTGRPIAGVNTSIQISVLGQGNVRSVDKILLLDGNGRQTDMVPLHHMGGRRGQALYTSHIVIPTGQFRLAIEGTDKSNHTFRRMDPVLMSTLSIKLEVLPLSGTLYISQTVTIPFRVTFVGGATNTDVEVSIIDDLGFSQPPTNYTYHMSSHASKTGHFLLRAGYMKGQTTTVTISAKVAGAPQNEVQYSVQRITVEEKIVRPVDTTSPTCNVTKTVGKCNFGSDVCACSNYTWNMSAVLGDVGFGLQSVFASGAGNKSVFTNDPFTVGHTVGKGVIHAHLSADCCHQHAKITVVDLAGNVALCDVTITPGFVPPAPKLCMHTNSLIPTATGSAVLHATRISCNITNVTGSCDLRHDTCSGVACTTANLCRNHVWTVNAQLGNEGFGKYQMVPVNAGRNSTFIVTNHSLSLSTDCCHPYVFVNVADIAGNVGQCHSNITVFDNRHPVVGFAAHNATISCNITNIVGSCDLRHDTCSGAACTTANLCKNHVWTMNAQLGNEGFGKYQTVPVNVGSKANLTVANHSLSLSADCCHTSVSVNVSDTAGNMGMCHAAITIYDHAGAVATPRPLACTAVTNDVCDLNPDCSNSANVTCGDQVKSCQQVTWNITMEITNGMQPISFKPVSDINVTLVNGTLELSGDCCHTHPSVEVIDPRGTSTTCRADIRVLQPSSDSGSSVSVGAIVGGVIGGMVVIGAGVAITIFIIKRVRKPAVDIA